ncbi:MAG TPA: DUF2007 domain-containing protein [Chitinophagales bacterium]|nr:DUF2007 domain-containing protein [Chitinophagales bacterium]
MDEHEWIKVFETTKMHRALIVQSILQEHEIESVILNKQDSSYIILGEIHVMVKLEDSIDAMIILEDEIA